MYSDNCFPAQYILGENVYIDDYYLDERWKRVFGLSDYWVSDKGRVWSERSQALVAGTPLRSGHIDISIRVGDNRKHYYLHRLVAEAFIPNPWNYPIVRHLDDDPSNSDVSNLAWGTQLDNAHDAIDNGHFVYFSDENRERAVQKRRMPIRAKRFSDGQEFEFLSQQEASRVLGVGQQEISNVIHGKRYGTKGYYFRKGCDEDHFAEAEAHYNPKRPLIKAENEDTGETFIFKGLTEAASALDTSVSSVSMVLSGKMRKAKGWHFYKIGDE